MGPAGDNDDVALLDDGLGGGVDEVLAVAKHFYDHKTFHPEFSWEARSAE